MFFLFKHGMNITQYNLSNLLTDERIKQQYQDKRNSTYTLYTVPSKRNYYNYNIQSRYNSNIRGIV